MLLISFPKIMLRKRTTLCLFSATAALCLAAQQATPTPESWQISGTLVDAGTSQPLPRARVSLAPVARRGDVTTVVTGEDGTFSFGDLPPGKYALIAQARGYLIQNFNQHEQFSSAIVVGPQLDASHLVFRLPRECAIEGVVTDEAAEAVRNAQVSVLPIGLYAGTPAATLRNTTTDDQGAFHFRHLLPGRYLVAVSATPWYAQRPIPNWPAEPETMALDVAYPITFAGGVTDPASATPLTLSSGDTATADIVLQPVRAIRIDLGAHTVPLGAAGYYSLSVPLPGGGTISTGVGVRSIGRQWDMVGVAPGRYLMTGHGDAAEERAREVEINANGEIDESGSAAFVSVSAKLQFDAGLQPQQASLQLLNKKSREATAERVGDTGEVVFKQGLRPGSYEISLSNNSGLYLRSISAEGTRVTGRTLEVRPGAPVKLAIAVARGQGQISGKAIRDEQPFAGAMIVLVPSDPGHNQLLFRRDQSDSDGSFTLSNVVPGTYTLLALEHGWDLAWMEPAVLKRFLDKGVVVQLQPSEKRQAKVSVQ